MDSNSVLRTGTVDLTADETLTTHLVGPMTRPMELMVLVPAVSAGDVLDVELEFCAGAASTTEVNNANFKQITTAGLYSMPFFTHLEYLQVKLNETDNGAPNFGGVKVWLAPAHRYDAPYNA